MATCSRRTRSSAGSATATTVESIPATDDPKIIAMEITQPEVVLDGGPPVRIRVKRAALTNEKVEGIKEILRLHPGDSAVYVHLEGPDRTTVLQLADEYLVDSSNGLYADLRVLLGADCIA